MPQSITKGTVSNAICSTLDLYPTILAMAGSENYQKEKLDGVNIVNTFFENQSVRSDIHYYRQDTLVALRHEHWKIYVKDPNPWNDEFLDSDLPLLYNIEHDPSEKYNIAKLNPDIINKLSQLVNEHNQSVETVPSQYDEILPSYKKAYEAYNRKN
jgi:arylsulfatase